MAENIVARRLRNWVAFLKIDVDPPTPVADIWEMAIPEEGERLARLRVTDRSWRRVRWGAAALTLFLFWLYEPSPGISVPFPLLPVGVAVAAAILSVNLLAWVGRRQTDARVVSRLGLAQLAADTVIVVGVLWLFTFDVPSSQWAVLVLPVLEGAVRWQLRGALGTWAVVAVGYVAREAWAAAVYPATFSSSAVTYRISVILIVAFIAGDLARSLERRITALEDARNQLEHAAFHDPLTGLPNRALFKDRMAQAAGRAGREHSEFAILFIDCDDFKAINDRFGHDAGDEALTELGQRLRNCVRPGDTVARMGGDEFTVLLEPPTHPEEAARVADRVLEVLREPFAVRGQTATLSASIGVATGTPSDDYDDLLRRADRAMYRAKQRGKDRYDVAPDGNA